MNFDDLMPWFRTVFLHAYQSPASFVADYYVLSLTMDLRGSNRSLLRNAPRYH